MKITICGSIAFIEDMHGLKPMLEQIGHEVRLPPYLVANEQGEMRPAIEYYNTRKQSSATDEWIWDRKEEVMRDHFDKVVWADAVLIYNKSKNNVNNYIGANTLMEMALAFHLKKKIYLMFPIPDMSYREEILGLKPVVIQQNLSLLQ